MDKTFFFIWSPTHAPDAARGECPMGSPGSLTIRTHAEASKQAALVAQQNPGHEFFVMQAVGVAFKEKTPEIYRKIPAPDPE